MSESPARIPVKDFLCDPASVLAALRSSEGPLIVTENGETAAVIVSGEAYERAQHERELLMLLARGEKEIAAGQGYDLDDVLKEADLILQDSKL
ncbi:MAG TPA: type II toxin-antitoxin system prevent-host-death family antitoxin [Blastocatellia bacterium]|jgi:prevent-host-death family protein